MSAVARDVTRLPAAPARIALLGTGTVGRAVLARLAQWNGAGPGAHLALVLAANSRRALHGPQGLRPDAARILLDDADDGCVAHAGAEASGGSAVVGAGAAAVLRASRLDAVEAALRGPGAGIVLDATASEAVADQHARWLAGGLHVVTACKLGQGAALARWQAIREACAAAGTRYGDSATVGAGLPVLHAIRALCAGGDRIHAIAGVLSGSLAWLFHHYDGLRPFSGFVREARAAGYTEPDPRDDLSGEDVRRKLLILARAAGVPLPADAVAVEALVPPWLAAVPLQDVDAALPRLDGALRERYAAAWKDGARLRFVARLDVAAGHARVGLEALPTDDPLAGGAGTDNRIAIWSDRYPRQPLLIQGPGAGAEVTAAAVLDDALRIARRAG